MEDSNEYGFVVSGRFDIDKSLQYYKSSFGDVVGFVLPDGRKADLFVGIRVEGENSKEEFLYSTQDLNDLGFRNLDYEKMEFEPFEEENEEYEGEEW